MQHIILILLGLGIILFLEELFWKKKLLSDEGQRKFGHIALGCFTASWPWLINWQQIRLLGALAIIFTLINYYTRLFHYLGLVKRGGYGDIFFALAIIACAWLTADRLFFAIAMLILALADASAALVGKKWGRQYSYKILGQDKSLIGLMTFWMVSLIIVGVAGIVGHSYLSYLQYQKYLIILPPVLALLENFSVWGADNLIVPVAAILLMKAFS